MAAPAWDQLFDVSGKIVLVTGGSRGVGKMIATGFVAHGASVYITSRDAKSCNDTVIELNKLGAGSCTAIPANLSQYSEVERLVDEMSKKEKKLHVLVNNAGVTWGSTLEDFPDEAFSKVLLLNLQRVFTLTQKLLPLLDAAVIRTAGNEKSFDDPARVINIGSVDGEKVPFLETYAYSSSKAGLHHMTRHMSGRQGSRGITFNSIAPGPFQSKMMKQTLQNFGEAIVSGIPLGRIGSPEDVAGTCIFLASRAGAYVNGANIALDGGSMTSPPARL
ncbi:MAG: hypothetical protein CYPHOPRED_000354 [Cyphobasidiales sp. Tagirdzhanova-0007]|nr:MAG: hypothetical protein CYPHOPRED_000354 [Cyphobasidiales sp. Tagirdzhanova-0007]